MNYKYLFFCFFSLMILLLAPACSDNFLEIRPDEAIPQSEFFKTPQDAQNVLNAAYDAITYDANVWILSEVMADNVNGVNLQGDLKTHYNWTTDIFLGTTRGLMSNSYLAIGRANYVLDYMDNISGLSDAEKARLRAECLFIRGMMHFELVRYFAQPWGYTANNTHLGIPIRIHYGGDLVNRSTVAQVYEQIIADLTEAANLLPKANGNYANVWAAKAYLAKVYFQQNDMPKALEMANDVINNGGFALAPTPQDIFVNGGTTEAIFQLVSTSLTDNAGAGISGPFRTIDNGGILSADIYAAQSLYDAYGGDTTDLRLKWYQIYDGGASPVVLCNKFPSATYFNVPRMRLAELLLIAAEANAETNNLTASHTALNSVRTRAGLLPANGLSAAELIALTRTERRRELAMEGNRLHELKRIALRDTPNLLIRNIAPWNCNGMVCQFPDNELQGHPDMEPNPAGGCQ
ncbi:MAG: RagB/SusD family nutrient uptake outer membrane protein [Chitinophagales bacterium]|jgi:tetratricopeptide (TPR) repeat protein|nr:RagB/SusD family nutrient uptake outer membrane protein [Chitinophagales bacterium]